MGFQNTANTITLTAKLTPSGRQKIVTNTNTLITKFAVGDSDANYNIVPKLTSGNIPSNSGNLSSNGSSSSTFNGVMIKSFLNVDASQNVYKSIESGSQTLSQSTTAIGTTTITGMTHIVTNRESYSDQYANLFHSFGLPLDAAGKTNFTGTTNGAGGYSDTALSGLGNENILILEIPNSNMGELVDGKTIKVYLETFSGTSAYTIYSTFENVGTANKTLDSYFIERSLNKPSKFGENIVFLFSDDIQKPNNDSSKSWATGYGTPKPFATYKKEKFNYQKNTNAGLVPDRAVGIAYLDKGLIVITEPEIADNFDYTGATTTSATSITFNSVSTEVSQQINCFLNRNEFATSKNESYTDGDIVRISEVGLYDDTNDLIAIAKVDRHILKQPTEPITLGIKVTI
jgi:hypothetical protein